MHITVELSQKLKKEYAVQSPALIHNSLIHLGLKDKGFCYDYTHDLLARLKQEQFKTIELLWADHKRGEYWEHNGVVVKSKKQAFEEGIILDAWRAEKLFFDRVKNDTSYNWELHNNKSIYFGSRL